MKIILFLIRIARQRLKVHSFEVLVDKITKKSYLQWPKHQKSVKMSLVADETSQ